jgi:hypothetical protein
MGSRLIVQIINNNITPFKKITQNNIKLIRNLIQMKIVVHKWRQYKNQIKVKILVFQIKQ